MSEAEPTLDPGEFKIERQDQNNIVASDGLRQVAVIADGREAKAFHRVAMRPMRKAGQEYKQRTFVAQLGKVRLYITGEKLILTHRDLYF